ncbi:MAG: LPXTG cell wall anchor domain-containing protein [Pirellulales bacterium]|nr:LPXTG cell wall anchor domain-containing protein [Pirellulales bacterium]
MSIREHWLEIAFAVAAALLLAQLVPVALWWLRTTRFHGATWMMVAGVNALLVAGLLVFWFRQRGA